jgi:hypothetical protein
MTSVLFGSKKDWADRIASEIDRGTFSPTFLDICNLGTDLNAFDVVVPLTLPEQNSLRALQGKRRANFLVPCRNAVQIADDKLRFNTWLKANGYGCVVPDLYGDDQDFPFIYKKRSDGYGENSHIISSPEELEQFESSIDRRLYFKQRYVPGRSEFTTHILACEGEIRFAGAFEFGFDRDYFVKGKHYAAVSRRMAAVCHLDLFRDILRGLGYSGTCCFNYKEESGRPLVFEMNPRFGASLCYMINPYLDAYLSVLAELNTALASQE